MFVHPDAADDAPVVGANDSAFLLLDFASGAHARHPRRTPQHRRSGTAHGPDRGDQRKRGDHRDPSRSLDGLEPAVSEIIGLRRGAGAAETLPVPAEYYGGTDPADAFAVFRQQSVGPRLFIDAIINDLPIAPDFNDGHQVQRIIDAAVISHETGIAQNL